MSLYNENRAGVSITLHKGENSDRTEREKKIVS